MTVCINMLSIALPVPRERKRRPRLCPIAVPTTKPITNVTASLDAVPLLSGYGGISSVGDQKQAVPMAGSGTTHPPGVWPIDEELVGHHTGFAPFLEQFSADELRWATLCPKASGVMPALDALARASNPMSATEECIADYAMCPIAASCPIVWTQDQPHLAGMPGEAIRRFDFGSSRAALVLHRADGAAAEAARRAFAELRPKMFAAGAEERWAFHGTSIQAAVSILQSGRFDSSMSKRQVHGAGSYLSPQPKFALVYADEHDSPDKLAGSHRYRSGQASNGAVIVARVFVDIGHLASDDILVFEHADHILPLGIIRTKRRRK